MATQESKLRVSLIDDVTRKSRVIAGALGDLQRKAALPLGGLATKLAAFGGAYLGVNSAIEDGFRPAADMQSAMTEIGIKADLSQTQLGQLQSRLQKLAPEVNQTTQALTGGIDTMLTMGLAANDASTAIPAVGKAATATGAAIDDLSAASVSAIQNLKVAPGLIQQMLDGMAAAGNAGAFELKDMAQYFPQLTASAQTLGMEGVPAINDIAAALQIARRGAGDASTAANNLSDFMGKIMTPQTIKNFKKFGVDVTKELQKAHKKGVSPIEHFIKLIDEKTKGGQGDLLTQIFGDKQTLDFIRPMISGFNDYLRIRDQADRANGTVADAFNRRMQDANQKIKAAQIGLSNLGMSIGASFLGPVGDGAQHLADILNTLDERATLLGKVQTGAQGFLNGLGLGSGELKDLAKEAEEFFFGVKDASKAADEYGRIFHRFQEWGRSIRSFYDQVKDNPLVKFFEQMSGYGFQLMLWSAGFAMLAGTITKLARAIAFLTGITTAVSIIKSLGSVGGILAGVPKGGAPSGAAGAPARGGFMNGVAALLGKVGTLASLATMLKGSSRDMTPEEHDAILMRSGTEWLKTHPFIPQRPDTYTGSEAQLSAQRGTAYSPLQQAVDSSNSPVKLDRATIVEMMKPSGVQDVKITNPTRPDVTIHAPISITGVIDPKAAAAAAVDQLGKAAKSAVEESFGGGGGF
ncbi:phage tail tape measure protein [Rhizobium leguminosarum]|uniref:phage tail tape measure protein n=1 Tax=Rhizobium leguminosarum TaxID=384 RepID=UPI000B926759|nr:phage tail tape measure protein [Rhizobium leguminosarum]ASS56892.1 phage tail tape measure protein [Rhizobium leguminosarum bv. viciae]